MIMIVSRDDGDDDGDNAGGADDGLIVVHEDLLCWLLKTIYYYAIEPWPW